MSWIGYSAVHHDMQTAISFYIFKDKYSTEMGEFDILNRPVLRSLWLEQPSRRRTNGPEPFDCQYLIRTIAFNRVLYRQCILSSELFQKMHRTHTYPRLMFLFQLQKLIFIVARSVNTKPQRIGRFWCQTRKKRNWHILFVNATTTILSPTFSHTLLAREVRVL